MAGRTSTATPEENTSLHSALTGSVRVVAAGDLPRCIEERLIRPGLYAVHSLPLQGDGIHEAFAGALPHIGVMVVTSGISAERQFQILRDWTRRIPVVTIVNSGGAEAGYMCARLGVCRTFDCAGIERRIGEFMHALKSSALLGILGLYGSERYKSGSLVECLLGSSPRTVSEWAVRAAMSRRYLAMVCRECLGQKPGVVLRRYHFYRDVLGLCPRENEHKRHSAVVNAIVFPAEVAEHSAISRES